MSRAGEFRADLNGLRGISIALVLAFHLQLKGAGGGFIGVDVFFVISGYLMTAIVSRSLAGESFSYWQFVCARAARIWPALAAMVVLLIVVGVWALPPFDMEILAQQAVRALLFSSNHYFLGHTGYITQQGDTQWLLHTWSLSVEWQFYLLYPLLLMLLAKLGASRRLVVSVLVLLMVMSLGWQLVQSHSGAEAGFFLLPGRAWELLAGGLVFFWLDREAAPPPSRQRAIASYAGLAMVIAAALGLFVVRARPAGAGAWLVLAVAGAMLVIASAHQGNVVLRNPLLQRLGLWSYSVYLWHWPLIVGLRLTDYRLEHPWATAIAILVASLVLGGLSYTFIERVGRTRTTWRMVLKPASFWLLAGLAVGAALATDGLAFRHGGGHARPISFESVKPLYFPDACSNFKKQAAELKTCIVDKGGRARVLVIGDSHAEHFYPWFIKNSPVSVDFFTASECPPVPRFKRQQPGYACDDYAQIAWRKAASADYDTVIVSARWGTAGLAGAPYCHQTNDGRCTEPPSLPAKQALILAELNAAIASALKAGKTVVMVDDTPESRFNIPDRLAREQFWYGKPRLVVPRSALGAQNAWFEPLFDPFRAEPNFHRVSLRGRLCDTDACRVHDPVTGRPIFFDEGHFEPVWIANQADLFAPFVRAR